MKTLRLITAIGLGALVAACGTAPGIPSRAAPNDAAQPPLNFQQDGLGQPAAAARAVMPQSINVASIVVRVPETLTVSESNGYYPRADIVWRGDVLGDRRAQIKAIFEDAFARGTSTLQGETPVIIDVQVKRFHSVTDRTRASVGGVHNMEFFLTVYDAETGAVLMPTREVAADLPALGGSEAIAADRQGQTQKVRVTSYLALTIDEELRKRPI
ncbi:DUF6778 family protein [Sulfitobacter sp. JB4-11]|uniref:DUF6778 family protein n=1 Tax=Sulfitobacter rhodophyticola TaxID=3238304 RepID=UPI003515D6F0